MSFRLWRDRWQVLAAMLFSVFAPLVPFTGCGGDSLRPSNNGAQIQRITGKVVLGNGTPLGQGKVVLTPREGSQETLSGWLDSDGVFTLMESQGLAISHGGFLVHIEPPRFPEEIINKSAQARAVLAKLQKAQQQFPTKYQKAETSNLKATIGPDTKNLPTFVLK